MGPTEEAANEVRPAVGTLERLEVSSLPTGMPRLSPGLVAALAEACAVCLDERGHEPGVTFRVDGLLEREYSLHWTPSTAEMQASFDDPEYATEQGAYCVAALVITRITDYRIVRRAKKKTGFDWWLARDAELPFQSAARLEVSGIRKGTNPQVASRLKIKERQTQQSDDLRIPAYAAVVEFSRPLTRVAER